MIPRLWNELVVGNPMRIEIYRYRRRYLSFSGSHAANSAVLALVLVCYAGIVLLVCNVRGTVSPFMLLEVQTGLFAIFAPGMLYGTIAGERERRSWDLLLVAPISKAQIVVGKLMGALTALGIAAGFLLVPILIAAFTDETSPFTAGRSSLSGEHGVNWFDLLEGELVSLSFTVAVCAMTILFSARVRRPFMAMANSLGLLLVGLVIIPSVLESLTGGRGAFDSTLYIHPFQVIATISNFDDRPDSFQGYITPSLWGIPQVLLYLAFSAVSIGWAINTLVFAENDVKFIPRRAVDA